MDQWPQVVLTGNEFFIPRVCPNCMAPADVPLPAVHVKQQFGSQARYTMTFYYCGACNETFRQSTAILQKQQSFWPLFGIWIGMFVLFLIVGSIGDYLEQGWLTLAALAGVIGLGWYLTRKLKARQQAMWDEEKPPLPPNAIGHGLAVYLIEMKGGVVRKKTATFAAARQDWLDLLVQSNSEAV